MIPKVYFFNASSRRDIVHFALNSQYCHRQYTNFWYVYFQTYTQLPKKRAMSNDVKQTQLNLYLLVHLEVGVTFEKQGYGLPFSPTNFHNTMESTITCNLVVSPSNNSDFNRSFCTHMRKIEITFYTHSQPQLSHTIPKQLEHNTQNSHTTIPKQLEHNTKLI